MLVRADINNPQISPDQLSTWLTDLVAAVGMNVLIPAQCVRCDTPGNEGVTGIICLETSHASIHIWDSGFLQFDLYSCKAFDPEKVAELFAPFRPVELAYQLIDRNETMARVIRDDVIWFDPEVVTGAIVSAQKMVAEMLRAPRLGRLTEEYEPSPSLTETARTASAPQE